MKKGIISLCIIMALLMVFSAIAMADEETTSENRAGSIIIKAGIIVPTDRVTVVDVNNTNLLGSANFTVEGEYVFYSTDYVDFSGIFGYYRTSVNNPTVSPANYYNFDNMNTIYYMAGAKFYPVKKGIYICGYVGGGTTFLKGTVYSSTAPTSVVKAGQVNTIDQTFSGVAFKGGVGYDVTKNLVVEAAYIVHCNEDLPAVLNSYNGNRFTNNGGIQIMGGYKF